VQFVQRVSAGSSDIKTDASDVYFLTVALCDFIQRLFSFVFEQILDDCFVQL
jgi:hypothetical protein